MCSQKFDEGDTQDDHFDPKSLYSDTRYVAVLCKSCNQKKTNNDLASASQLNTYIQTYPEKFEEWFNTKYKKSA
jgi:5-methylcytosine-specific restriction endonuclease McrA